ncbi:hypothetical protein BJ165DRAFT_1482820 [Panaeolus papilionaceus]|nr:hypothetical protein BJ165DRAFT_1482820 [Panaeolus papilionaceus]
MLTVPNPPKIALSTRTSCPTVYCDGVRTMCHGPIFLVMAVSIATLADSSGSSTCVDDTTAPYHESMYLEF